MRRQNWTPVKFSENCKFRCCFNWLWLSLGEVKVRRQFTLRNAFTLSKRWLAAPPVEMKSLVLDIVERVTVAADRIEIRLNRTKVAAALEAGGRTQRPDASALIVARVAGQYGQPVAERRRCDDQIGLRESMPALRPSSTSSRHFYSELCWCKSGIFTRRTAGKTRKLGSE
jgi:hypothetical protein